MREPLLWVETVSFPSKCVQKYICCKLTVKSIIHLQESAEQASGANLKYIALTLSGSKNALWQVGQAMFLLLMQTLVKWP